MSFLLASALSRPLIFTSLIARNSTPPFEAKIGSSLRPALCGSEASSFSFAISISTPVCMNVILSALLAPILPLAIAEIASPFRFGVVLLSAELFIISYAVAPLLYLSSARRITLPFSA